LLLVRLVYAFVVSALRRMVSGNRASLDSHADTCCAGANTLLIAMTGRTVNVYPFSKELSSMSGIPIATVAMAWDNPDDGKTTCLVLNECLYMGDRLQNSLLNPNQLRANGLQVDDIPRQFDPKSTHSIRWKDSPDVIPLDLRGIISGFPCRKPTPEEWRDCHRLELTSDEVP